MWPTVKNFGMNTKILSRHKYLSYVFKKRVYYRVRHIYSKKRVLGYRPPHLLRFVFFLPLRTSYDIIRVPVGKLFFWRAGSARIDSMDYRPPQKNAFWIIVRHFYLKNAFFVRLIQYRFFCKI